MNKKQSKKLNEIQRFLKPTQQAAILLNRPIAGEWCIIENQKIVFTAHTFAEMKKHVFAQFTNEKSKCLTS